MNKKWQNKPFRSHTILPAGIYALLAVAAFLGTSTSGFGFGQTMYITNSGTATSAHTYRLWYYGGGVYGGSSTPQATPSLDASSWSTGTSLASVPAGTSKGKGWDVGYVNTAPNPDVYLGGYWYVQDGTLGRIVSSGFLGNFLTGFYDVNTPDDPRDKHGCGGESGCSSCSGMPVWRVSEPYVSLWLDDEPLGYQPVQGSRISLQLSFNQREVYAGFNAGLSKNVFSIGKRWNCSWLSFVARDGAGNTNVFLPGGGQTTFSAGVDYLANDRLSGNATSGFTNTHPDGSKDVYGFVITNSSGVFQKAFLTERWNAQTEKTLLNYDTYNPADQVIRLLYVIDGDGRTNSIYYNSTNAFSTNLISYVADAFGRTNYLLYDTTGHLTDVIDVAGISSSFAYDNHDLVTGMTTPYGTTSFAITEPAGGSASDYRSVLVTNPDGGKELYLYLYNTPGVPTSYSSPDLPSTSPFSNTFDNSNLNLRNSYYWGPRQYAALSTTTITSFTANDFYKARMKHWMISPNSLVGYVPSLERKPSPDSSASAAEGQKIWYDYAGKPSNDTEGTQVLPLCVAQVLPDGSTHFTRTERNSLGTVTDEINTYSVTAGGSVLLRTNRYTFSADGIDLVTVTNALGIQTSSNAYNAFHQVVTNFNALGEATVYTYNANQQLTSMRTPAGLTTTNIYFTTGTYSNWLDTTIDLEIGRTNSFTYTNGLVFTRTDERGLTLTNTYDALQRLTKVNFPDGTFITNSYRNLDLVNTVDRMGFTNSFGFDSMRRRVAETNALGFYTLYNYCSCGSLDSVQDAAGNFTYFYYDNLARMTNTVSPDGYAVTNRYNLIGQMTNTVDSANTSATNWFNNQGLVVGVSNAFGRVSGTTFDVLDRATNSVDANGVTVTNAFDSLNRIRTRTYPDTGLESFGYTANKANVTSYTNQLSNVTCYGYDVASRKTAETNANLEVTQFSYNAAGDLLSLTDGKNQITMWTYDLFGRATNKVDASSTEIFRFAFDPNNRLTNRWTAAKGTTTYRYDPLSNLTNVDYAVSPDITLQYDSINRLTNMMDAVGTTAFSYTSVGQLLSEDGPWNNDTVSYAYTNRLRASLSLLQQSTGAWTNGYTYDAMKRLTNITSQAGSFDYQYLSSQPSTLVQKLSLPNTAFITNSYDSVARMFSTQLKNSGGTVLNSHSYNYNVGNQRTKQTRTDGSYVDYTYDPTSQLKTALGKESGGTTNRLQEQLGYTYDAAGNLNYRTNNALVQTFNVNNLNEVSTLTRSGTLTVAGNTTTAATNVTVNSLTATRYTDKTWAKDSIPLVDDTTNFTAIARTSMGLADTNVVTVDLRATNTFAYDLNGNLRTNGTEVLEYDDENRLVTNYVACAWKSEFTYDARNRRRIQRDYGWISGAWVKTNELRLVYDGNVPLQHRDSGNSPTLTLTRGLDLSGSREGAGGIGGLLAMTEGSGTNGYYHADGNGNVTCIVNTNQLVVAKYLYDSFGSTLSISGPKSSINPYRFSSKPIHTASGKFDYLYRWYSPELQRWANRDPIEERGGLNLFRFVENNSANSIDLYGLKCVEDTFKNGQPALVFADGNKWTLTSFDYVHFGTYSAVTIVKGFTAEWEANVGVRCRCSCPGKPDYFETRIGRRRYSSKKDYTEAQEFYIYQLGSMPINITTFSSILNGIGKVAAKAIKVPVPTTMTGADAKTVAGQVEFLWPKDPQLGKWIDGSPCK